jgi:hypothetical protein
LLTIIKNFKNQLNQIMKRLILNLLVLGSAFAVFAQSGTSGVTSVKMKPHNTFIDENVSGTQLNFENTHVYKRMQLQNNFSGSRAGRGLGFVQLGTAGNLFTILDGSVNRLAASEAINSIVFIHRADPVVDPNSNVAQFKYDISKNGGNSFTIDLGPITPGLENFDTAGRYPNITFHVPSGVTNPDNAYLSYLGTWLPYQGGSGRTWDGVVTGVARLNGDTATITKTISRPNNGDVSIAKSMVNGQPGEFWAVNFATQPNDSTKVVDVVLHKGTWNPSTNDVEWTFSLLNVPFVMQAGGGAPAADVHIAFDPTGNNGWVSILGDVSADADSTLNPIFYQTTDGGDNWTGPIELKLSTLANVKAGLTLDTVPTTGFDSDLLVDANGNPHLLVVVGSSGGTGYSIATAAQGGGPVGLKIYDITYNPNGSLACQWQAIYLDDIATFRGTLATAGGAGLSEDNRPQASRSENGNLLFFGWCDSDPTQVTNNANELPNFKGIMINISNNTATQVVNFTENDSLFIGGATFASTAPTLLTSGSTYTVPTVFAQVNTNSGSGEDPANFFYIQDITFDAADFTNSLGADIPVITLLGDNPDYVYLGESFNDPGATADDCNDGDLTSSITVNTSGLNTNSRGTYNVVYEVTDSDNNNASAVRQVIVNTEPDARFGYVFTTGRTVSFRDSSLYNPTSWEWDFGYQGNGSIAKNPTYTYLQAGTYTVCLKARNNYNSAPFNKPVDQECKTITVTGIEEKLADNAIAVYPNPTKGIINLEVVSADYKNASVEVYNVVGESVFSSPVILNRQNIFRIDITGNANGIYLVKFTTDKGSITKRISIM